MNIFKRIWLMLKSGFLSGVEIGKQGKQKDFIKNPFKTIEEVNDENKITTGNRRK